MGTETTAGKAETGFRPGPGGETLAPEEHPFLVAMTRLYLDARRAGRAAFRGMKALHKGRREAAIDAMRAAAEAARTAESAIDAYMLTFRQPVEFVHRGWRWCIPSAGRGLILTRCDREATRRERKEGTR